MFKIHIAELHIHIEGLGASQMAEIKRLFTTTEEKIMITLDQLIESVEAQSGQVESLKTFVIGMEQQIKDALSGVNLPPASQAKVDAVFAKVGANSQAIADAIDSNPDTPAPVPPVDPAPV